MKLLYAARCAYPLINKPITSLASQICRWSVEADRRLHRIYEFLSNSLDLVLTGSLSVADRDVCKIRAYADSDLGGDVWSPKSTTGYWVEVQGADGRSFPLSWAARFQGSSSTHTCESETVSLCDAIKREVIPLKLLMERLLNRTVDADIYEDNAACIISVSKGYSPAMRYIGRTQKVQLGFLHDVCNTIPEAGRDSQRVEPIRDDEIKDKPINLKKVGTDEQKADLFTKELDRIKFKQLAPMIGMRSKLTTQAAMVAISTAVIPQSESYAEGVSPIHKIGHSLCYPVREIVFEAAD